MSFTKNKITLILGFLICTLFIIYNSVYTVLEGYTAVLSRATSTLPKTNLLGPGLHFKLPFFGQPIPIDMRLQSFSFKKANALTTNGYPLIIDYYVKWQITNPTLYYLKTGNNVQQTQQRLAQTINTLLQNDRHTTLNNTIDNIQPMLHTLLIQTNTQSKLLGITVVDIGFKSINVPAEADTSLIKNMRAEQTRLAIEQRAIGKANAISIREKADNQASLLLAKAKEKAAIIRGLGDTIASKIYSEAYRKNPQFAAFYLNLETYKKGFTQSSSNNNFLVLNMGDDFSSTKKELSLIHSKNLG